MKNLDHLKKIDKKMAIITGASQGIGKATAARFLQENWQVINLSRKNCDLSGVQNVAVDFSSSDWQTACSKKIMPMLEDCDQISLIHNAAYYHKDNIRHLQAEDLRAVFEVGLVAPIILNNMLLPQMKKNSSIIYVGSTLSEKAVPNTASYSIYKHAVLGMMRATCQDLIGTQIHTSCVCPGITETEMLQAHAGHDAAVLEMLRQKSTMGRMILPNEIANTIYFCATHPVINGAVLHANLGQVES